jgi:hypothetical protein
VGQAIWERKVGLRLSGPAAEMGSTPIAPNMPGGEIMAWAQPLPRALVTQFWAQNDKVRMPRG